MKGPKYKNFIKAKAKSFSVSVNYGGRHPNTR